MSTVPLCILGLVHQRKLCTLSFTTSVLPNCGGITHCCELHFQIQLLTTESQVKMSSLWYNSWLQDSYLWETISKNSNVHFNVGFYMQS